MNYLLELNLTGTENSEIETIYFDGKSEYVLGQYDEITITNRKIIIKFKRSGTKDVSQIMLNDKSTIVAQVNRCLCYLYGLTGYPFNVLSLSIKNQDKVSDVITYNDLNQPFNDELLPNLRFNKNVLEKLFTATKSRDSLTIALTLFFKAFNLQKEGDRFSELWKAFNCVYTYLSPSSEEIKKLIDIRKIIHSEQLHFTSSFNSIDTHTKDDIRKLLIRDMILNNYDSFSKTTAFRDFMLRYEDHRINEVFQDILPYRKDYLSSKGYLTTVEGHIRGKILCGKKNNEDLLCFYVLKYCYFLRNKYFHAEKPDSSFNLLNTIEIDNIKSLNDLLFLFIHDLLSITKLY